MLTGLSAPTVEDKSRDTSVDSSRVVPIDCKSYLIIGPDGEYTTSDEPKELPQGFVVHAMNDDVKGQRQFIITKDASDPYDESDTFDDVKVGTLMVQNGFAYIAGKVIHGEEPKSNMKRVYIPPFVMTYPILTVLHKMRDEVHLNIYYEKERREILLRSIRENNEDIVKVYECCLEFDIKRRFDISQEYRCDICGCEITDHPGCDFCEVCASKTLEEIWEYERLNGIKRYGGDKVETHEDMDTDNGEDDVEGLREKLGSTLDIGTSKQTGSLVN